MGVYFIVHALFYGYTVSMGYIEYNKNPCGKHTTDCTVRALSTLTGEEWDSVYLQLCLIGLSMCEMPSQKAVIHEFLKQYGYQRFTLSNRCPACYSVNDFTNNHRHETYLLATDSHVVPVIDGMYIDNWDSGDEIPLFYWSKGDRENAV